MKQRLKKAPAIIWDSLRMSTYILRALYLLKRYQKLEDMLERLDRKVFPLFLQSEAQSHLIQGANWGTRFWMPRTKGRCLTRSLALYMALKAQGKQPIFVSGVMKAEAGIIGHAWIELEGEALRGFGDEHSRARFSINVVFPPSIPSRE